MEPHLTQRQKKILASIAAVLIAVAALIGVLTASEDQAPAPQPAPAPSVSAPAPLPPETGVDGAAVVGVPDAQTQPDGLPEDTAGIPVVPVPAPGPAPGLVVEEPSADPGTGGEIYVHSPVWKGRQRLNAGAYYPSGGAHWAWDVGVWRGTKLFAARKGRMVGSRDGVPNHPTGGQYAISGSPSNWLMLCSRMPNGREALLHYQHLSPGLIVSRGKVAKGDPVARSGNTGNSTGDHLHIDAQWLRKGQTCKTITRAQADAQRYDYLASPSLRRFAPAKFWRIWPLHVGSREIQVRKLKKQLHYKNHTSHYGKGFKPRWQKWQARHGHIADGLVTREQYRQIVQQ